MKKTIQNQNIASNYLITCVLANMNMQSWPRIQVIWSSMQQCVSWILLFISSFKWFINHPWSRDHKSWHQNDLESTTAEGHQINSWHDLGVSLSIGLLQFITSSSISNEGMFHETSHFLSGLHLDSAAMCLPTSYIPKICDRYMSTVDGYMSYML